MGKRPREKPQPGKEKPTETYLAITDLFVWNQNGDDATLFDYIQDAISFVADIDLSPNLTKDLTNNYQVDFQVIEAVTNHIIVNSVQVYQITEDWPMWRCSVGNNWATPYSTAYNTWGLDEFNEPPIFGFRAILTAFGPGNGPQIDAFDVSSIRWFQIRGNTAP